MRKFIKILLISLISILGIIALLSVFINLPFSHRFLTKQANQMLSNAGLPIHIQSIRTILPTTVKLQGVTIADFKSDTIIYAEELKADYVLPALMAQKVILRKVFINYATVELSRKDSTSRYGIEEVFSPDPGPEDPEPGEGKKYWELYIKKGRLTEISFLMNDPVTGIDILQHVEGIKLKDFDLLLRDRAILLNSVDLVGARGGLKISPPLVDKKSKIGSSWSYGLKNLSLSDLNFTFSRSIDSLELNVSLDKGLVKINQMDLDKKEFDIDKLSLDQANATILKGDPANEARPDFSITDLDMSLSDIRLDSINAALELKKLSFDTGNGFTLKSAKGRLDSPSGTTRLDMAIETGNSQFKLEGAANEGFFDFIAEPTQVENANISFSKASFSLRDIFYFKVDLQENPLFTRLAKEPITIEGDLGLENSVLKLKRISLSQARNFVIALEGSAEDPFEPGKARGKLRLDIPTIDIAWLGSIFEAFGLGGYTPEFSSLSIASTISNTIRKPDFNLTLSSDLGEVDLFASLDFDRDSISGNADFGNLELGMIMNMEELGLFNGSGNFSGSGFKGDSLLARVNVQLDSLWYHDYNYTATTIDATLRPGVYQVNLLAEDPSLKGNLNAVINPAGSILEVQASGAVSAQLNRLHFLQDTLFVATNFKASLTKSRNALDTDFSLSNLLFATPQDSADIQQISASFRTDSVFSTLKAEADFLRVDLKVAHPFSELGTIGQDYGNYLATFTDPHHLKASDRVLELPEINATGEITYHNGLGLFIRDTTLRFKDLRFSIINIPSDHKINYNIWGTGLEYKVVEFGNLNTTVSDSAGILNLQIVADNNSINSIPAYKIQLNSHFAQGQSLTGFTIQDKLDEIVYGLEISTMLDSNNIVFNVPSKELILNREHWQMDTSALLSVNLDTKKISPELKMHTDNSFLHLFTESEEGIYTYKGELGNVGIVSLLREGVISGKPAGSISGSIDYSLIGNIEKKLHTDLEIRDFKWSGLSYSNIGVNGTFKIDSSKAYGIDLSALLDSSKIVVQGDKIYGGSGTVNAVFSSVPINTFQPFVKDYLSDLGGRLSGNVNLSSREDQENFFGNIYITDANLRINTLNAKFKIPEDSVRFSGQKVVFDKFKVVDSLGNTLFVNGFLNLKDRQLPTLDMEISSSKLQVMNRSEKEDVPLYGNIFIDSRLSVKGPLANPDIKGKILLSEGTDVFYRMMEDLTLSETEKILSFVSYSSTGDQETGSPIKTTGTFINSSIETIVVIDPGTRINFNLAKRVYNIDVIIKGRGSLNYNMLNNNQVTLSGKYEISDGSADVKLIGWPNKSFRIAEGGFIRWEGPLDNPVLSFEAVNKVGSSYTNPMDGKQRNVDFNVILKLSKQLSDLDILFTINTTDQYLMSIINTLSPEEQMRQALTILLFEYIDLPGISTSSNYMSQQVNQLLAAQLNSLAKTSIQGIDISFGIDSYVQATSTGGEETKTSLSYEVRKNFLNDRAQIEFSGRLNDLSQQQGASDLSLNNLSFEYRLDSAASKYLKVYNEHSYEDVFTGEVTKTGVGFTYRKRYKTFKDIWRRKKKNKNKKTMNPVP